MNLLILALEPMLFNQCMEPFQKRVGSGLGVIHWFWNGSLTRAGPRVSPLMVAPIPLVPPTGTGVLPGKMAWIPRVREYLGATAESQVCAHSQAVPQGLRTRVGPAAPPVKATPAPGPKLGQLPGAEGQAETGTPALGAGAQCQTQPSGTHHCGE